MDFSDMTIVIPAKDEPAIGKVVEGCLAALEECKIIVLFNGYDGKPPVFKNKRIEIFEAPLGKGNAIKMLQQKKLVKTPMMGFVDGDATYEPKNFKKMVEMVRSEGYDMVLGNRFHDIDTKVMPKVVQLGNNVLTDVANALYGLDIVDSQTGIRVLKTSAFQSLELTEGQFGIEEEMNIKMKKSGFKIGEIPANYYVRIGEEKHQKMLGGFKLLAISFRFIFYRPPNK